MDVNAQYKGFEFNYTYLIFCGYIVWLIIPGTEEDPVANTWTDTPIGIGLLYGGDLRFLQQFA